jgi:ATP-dependent Zn protease
VPFKTKRRTPDEIWRAAIHEAGHVIAARHFKREIKSATIRSRRHANGNEYGHVSMSLPNAENVRINQLSIVLLSGIAAEKAFLEKRPGQDDDFAHSADAASLKQLLSRFGLDADVDFAFILAEHLKQAIKLVERRPLALKKIAQALFLRTTLTGAEIDALLRRRHPASGNK